MLDQNLPHLTIVHPLVLLSVVDHYNRNNKSRSVGILLGSVQDNVVDITNSYAIPFDEDNDSIYFDHNFHEKIYTMFRKINTREHVVGWYSTGDKISQNDQKIHNFLKQYCNSNNPVYLMIQQQETKEIPIISYVQLNKKLQNGEIIQKFQYIQNSIQACQPEEIGVQHLLRDIQKNISDKDYFQGLKDLKLKIVTLQTYVQAVIDGKKQYDDQIVNNIQKISNLVRLLSDQDVEDIINEQNQQSSMITYMAYLNRTMLSVDQLIMNKIDLK